MIIETYSSIRQISEADWRSAHQQTASVSNPFLSYAFFDALEQSQSASIEKGWQANHLVYSLPLEPVQNNKDDKTHLVTIAPCYIKTNSWGEYVFDWSWAEAFERYQQNYYPKLVCTIPFTPVTSDKRLTPNPHLLADKAWLESLTQYCEQHKINSWHVLFTHPIKTSDLPKDVYQRNTVQFIWHNKNYQDFTDFVSHFTSRKRKNTLKERQSIAAQNITIKQITGDDISQADIDFFYQTYAHTYLKKGHSPHLSKAFFETIRKTLSNNMLLVIASINTEDKSLANNENDNQKNIAAALYFFDDKTLYGRYWGCLTQIPNLHFELCYYQGIEFCIQHKLATFNPGTQGEHKIARGFEPTLTYSYHWIKNTLFKAPIKNFCLEEQAGIKQYFEQCKKHLPYKIKELPEMELPFSQACENNKNPILSVLSPLFKDKKSVLEVGSGTGQHAIYFAQQLPHLNWQTSDLPDKHAAINYRVQSSNLANVKAPITIDLSQLNRLKKRESIMPVDALFTANTLHIISQPLVDALFEFASYCVVKGGHLCIYGPFNYQGQYTSQSNAAFDERLKQRDPNSGIRHFEDIIEAANQAGFELVKDHEMPANNRLLVLLKR